MITKIAVFILAIILLTSVSAGMLSSMSGFVDAKKSESSDSNSGSGGGSSETPSTGGQGVEKAVQGNEASTPPTIEPIKDTTTVKPIEPTTPDKGCAFHPDSPKCKPDNGGNCPTGFSHNENGNCFPSGKCPNGSSRHDNDESGKCFPNHNPHKTIVIVKHTSSSSSSGNHNLSSQCFNEIKIAWLGKIKRGTNQAVDNIIDKCLGIK